MDKHQCGICGLKYKSTRSLSIHIKSSHKISTEEYYIKYININKSECSYCKSKTRFVSLGDGYSKYCGIKCSKVHYYSDVNNRIFVSEKTKIAMKNPIVKEKMSKFFLKKKSKETLEKMSISSKKRFEDENFKKKIYTKERNEKISIAKKKYWDTHPEEKKRVGQIWKTLKEEDESRWRENLLRASRLGFKKIFSPSGNTSLEEKLYKQLELENIKYIPQYVIDYKVFDAYLPDYNLVIEVDGMFWHPKSLDECKYKFQKTSYFNDLEKENLLKQKDIKLIRIRENEFPESIINVINK